MKLPKHANRRLSLKIVSIVCVAIVLIITTVSWVYVRNQEIQQKDRALTQQAQNLKYEQEQINKRQQFEETCKYQGNVYTKYGAGC